MPWKAVFVPGVDALAGSVPFNRVGGYDLQNGPPSRDPGDTGPPGTLGPHVQAALSHRQVSTSSVDDPDLAGPGEVIDSLLADRKFSRWLAERSLRSTLEQRSTCS